MRPYSLVLFDFRYPYNNFVHHHIENIIVSCLESKNAPLVEHLLRECDLVGKILQAEKNFTLSADGEKVALPSLYLVLNFYRWQLWKWYVSIVLFHSIFYFLQPTIPAEGRAAPRIGNIGHLTRISNKLIHLGNNNSEIQTYLQVFSFAYFCLLVFIA